MYYYFLDVLSSSPADDRRPLFKRRHWHPPLVATSESCHVCQ
ncbi:unnamed protein product [Acanthoscelides obtectus]|uniref:Uncharacterized protein n=1 Tax=Acanthoscelides obtectus TaxID=200917 RepID=A0A9P0JUI9_ACAOB|nr:unnamed protein product [Acanthoscelides obtectus]CAK1640674.1 hypothetical protein AOBTE_LOCUS11865 [Acanthoscelides obtectus]